MLRPGWLLSIVLILLFVSSCAHKECPRKKDYRYVQAIAWWQNSAEYRALALQSFNIAKVRINEAKRKKTKKPLAVIADIDETLLDNSPYQVRALKTGQGYPVGWDEWIKSASANPIPGAVDFAKFAKRKNIEFFYVSNRKHKNLEPTLKNLKEVGFPAKRENVLLRTTTGDKQPRRDKVLKNYHVVAYLGDNLGDFATAFDVENVEKRFQVVEQMKNKFGNEYIVFPNPVYGNWEGAIFEGNYRRSNKEKRDVLIESMKDWQ